VPSNQSCIRVLSDPLTPTESRRVGSRDALEPHLAGHTPTVAPGPSLVWRAKRNRRLRSEEGQGEGEIEIEMSSFTSNICSTGFDRRLVPLAPRGVHGQIKFSGGGELVGDVVVESVIEAAPGLRQWAALGDVGR
jgi:hypothetical protein